MDEEKFKKRGWICGLMAPVACLLFLALQWLGVWGEGVATPAVTILAGILMVEMIAGTAAPFWWLLMAYRRRGTARQNPTLLMGLNAFAIVVSLVFFF